MNAKILKLINIGEFYSALRYIEEYDYEKKNEYTNIISREYEKRGLFDKSLELAQRVADESIKRNDLVGLLGAYNNKLLAHIRKLNYGVARELIDEVLNLVNEISEESNSKLLIQYRARLLNLIGLYHKCRGDFDRALIFYSDSLEIRRKNNHILGLGSSLVHLSILYLFKGDLDISVENNLEAMRLFQQENDEYYIGFCLHVMGITYKMKGDLHYSENYFKKSLESRRKLRNPELIAETAFELFMITHELKHSNDNETYLQNLQDLCNETNSRIIEVRYKIASAMYIQSTNRIINLARSQEIYKSIVDDDVVLFELSLIAKINFIESLLDEFKMIRSEILQEEIERISGSLLNILVEQGLNYHIIEIHLLLYRFETLNFDFNKASYHINIAMNMVQEGQFERFVDFLDQEKAILAEKLDRYTKFIKENEILGTKVYEAKLVNSLNTLIKSRNIDGAVLQTSDEPVFILLLNGDGISLFSSNFDEKIKINKALISGFLMASDLGISNAINGQEGSFETIKYGRYTLIFQKSGNVTCCYAFVGPIHLATQRMYEFMTRIKTSDEIQDILNRRLIQPKLIKTMIDPILHEIFPDYFQNRI